MNIFARLREWFDRYRLKVASPHAAIALVLFGLVSGILSGTMIVLFRLLIEGAQETFMGRGQIENFESLSATWRFALPTVGGLVIGLLYQFISESRRRVGVTHVMERLQYHEGHLPFRNLFVQFFGGAMSLICGHSVGREAPSIHLGAGISSLFGQFLHLPNNSIRTLVACGTAAAIAASFNTPLAGVVFAMEVVLMEYTIAGFTPVIIAAVAATVITRLVFGSAPVFFVPQLGLTSLWALAYIVFMGMCVGGISATFVAGARRVARYAETTPVWLRMAGAGVLVGAIGLLVPQVLGMGYDTVNGAIMGDIALTSLVVILVAKLVASAFCVGTDLPGGLIGPTIVIGATLGGIFAFVSTYLPVFEPGPAVFAMLGMGAMMSATLQAPLAALLALMELTDNPHLIMPAMLAIVSANITAKELFKQDSIFTTLMRDAGLDYRNDPVAQNLRRVGVAALMNRSFVESAPYVDLDTAMTLLAGTPHWIIVRHEGERRTLLRASDLARFLQERQLQVQEIGLMEVPAQRLELAPVHLQATMQEARKTIEESGVEALYVRRPIAPLVDKTYGVLLRQDIEASYIAG